MSRLPPTTSTQAATTTPAAPRRERLTTHPRTGRAVGSPVPVTDGTKCGARLRGVDPPRYCLQWRVSGSTRCRMHGGTSARGVAAPAFRNGTHSIYVPNRMRSRYEAALADPDLLSLRREVAAHRTAADDLRRRIDEGDGAGAGLQTAWRDFRAAHRAGNPDRLAEALTRLEQAVSQHAAQDALRKELRAETELLSKLTRAEGDRMEQLHMMVSREQALAYMRGLAVAVKEAVETHVREADVRTLVLRAVGARFEQLADRRSAADPRPGLVGGAVDPEDPD